MHYPIYDSKNKSISVITLVEGSNFLALQNFGTSFVVDINVYLSNKSAFLSTILLSILFFFASLYLHLQGSREDLRMYTYCTCFTHTYHAPMKSRPTAVFIRELFMLV